MGLVCGVSLPRGAVQIGCICTASLSGLLVIRLPLTESLGWNRAASRATRSTKVALSLPHPDTSLLDARTVADGRSSPWKAAKLPVDEGFRVPQGRDMLW